MRITATSTTAEVLSEVGSRLTRMRLQQNWPSARLAERAGVGERTVRRAESGENPSLATLVKLLRALGRLDAFDDFLPEPLVSPLQLAENRVHERQRAWAPRKKRGG
jgi:transcriptional regulator with XRE-family HTH domain